jgi:hypothetical protein
MLGLPLRPEMNPFWVHRFLLRYTIASFGAMMKKQ